MCLKASDNALYYNSKVSQLKSDLELIIGLKIKLCSYKCSNFKSF